ncbi:RagB/SusD family nutrient uptake outer membrane protein [Pedobacter sp. BS3]|uniref:RagB/SusD family nutrient uptake outer membrane protein n=1 Tax=Pedobacter sp. BS3 TaxID=2567937 RepID=UPI0011F0262A|nr:RagB/SusD family nutrient uptake outer membrane protein [Pedobacter sp. BS3]TZF81831.1 RagB/SusD family nutrient uptake outer membrane protein [Pedobacter sp. BS3]
MKKIVYSILISSLFFASCKKFLDTTPTDFLSPKNYYKTEAEVKVALAGVYDVLGKSETYGRYLFFEMDVADDSFIALSTWTQDVGLYNYSPGDVKIEATWSTLYNGINRANVLLESLNDSSLPEATKKVAEGQALFLRAYYYFILVNNWGNVPLRLTATASTSEVNFPRTPYKTVYQQIISDMEKAADLVDKTADGSRVTQPVVWGMLARVNLKMAGAPLRDKSRYAEAAKWAKKVMDESGSKLNADYTEVFKNLCRDVFEPKEVLWEVSFGNYNSSQVEEGAVGGINGIGTSNLTIGYSYGAKHTVKSYYDSFETGDLRRDWNINTYYYTSATDATKIAYSPTAIYNRCDAKFRREYELASSGKFTNTTAIDFPLLRYADVLLMYAEAENEVNGPANAYNAINQVRRRAFGLPVDATSAVDLQGLDQDGFRNAVRAERSKELGYEGLRRFDLVRWGQFVPAMKAVANEMVNATGYTYGARSGQNVTAKDTLFAIPSSEMALNKEMVQNPGW